MFIEIHDTFGQLSSDNLDLSKRNFSRSPISEGNKDAKSREISVTIWLEIRRVFLEKLGQE